jgi:hypothetical protein
MGVLAVKAGGFGVGDVVADDLCCDLLGFEGVAANAENIQ